MQVEDERGDRLCLYLHVDQCVLGQYDGKPTAENCAECERYAGRPRGLGDNVANVLSSTGIDKAVKGFVKSVGIKDCGCGKRRKYLNDMFPNQDGKP